MAPVAAVKVTAAVVVPEGGVFGKRNRPFLGLFSYGDSGRRTGHGDFRAREAEHLFLLLCARTKSNLASLATNA